METYNGWKNVSLWIANDESLYRSAVDFMKKYRGRSPYAAFIRENMWERERTPDNIGWLSTPLDHPALNEFMRELAS